MSPQFSASAMGRFMAGPGKWVVAIIALTIAVPLALRCCSRREAQPARSRLSSLPEAERFAEIIVATSNDLLSRAILRASVDALAELGEGALPGLQRLLQEQDESVLLELNVVLGRITFPDASWDALDDGGGAPEDFSRPVRQPWLEPLLRKGAGHRSTNARQACLRFLSLHAPDPVPDLVAATADPDEEVRAVAFWLLRDESPKAGGQVGAPIARGLSDTSQTVRGNAILAAGALRVRSAVPSLVALLRDDSVVRPSGYIPDSVLWQEFPAELEGTDKVFRPKIQELAAYAIQKITGKDFGFKSCYDSRNDMPEIARKIRHELAATTSKKGNAKPEQ